MPNEFEELAHEQGDRVDVIIENNKNTFEEKVEAYILNGFSIMWDTFRVDPMQGYIIIAKRKN